MASFCSGVCVEDVVNIETNYQFTSAIVINFMNVAKMDCQKNCFKDIKHNQIERLDEKPRYQRQLFQNLDNFYIY